MPSRQNTGILRPLRMTDPFGVVPGLMALNYTTKREILRSVLRFFPLSADQHVNSRQRLRVLRDYRTLNAERTEHRRDLSVEALGARRPQRTSNLVAAHGRAVFLS